MLLWVQGSANGQFDNSYGIALSPNASIHISDKWNKKGGFQTFSNYY